MINLTEKDVRDFQRLYKKRFGVKIDYKTAELEGARLIWLVAKTQPKNMDIGMEIDEELPFSSTPSRASLGEAHGNQEQRG